jgi:hypothetical protein
MRNTELFDNSNLLKLFIMFERALYSCGGAYLVIGVGPFTPYDVCVFAKFSILYSAYPLFHDCQRKRSKKLQQSTYEVVPSDVMDRLNGLEEEWHVEERYLSSNKVEY